MIEAQTAPPGRHSRILHTRELLLPGLLCSVRVWRAFRQLSLLSSSPRSSCESRTLAGFATQLCFRFRVDVVRPTCPVSTLPLLLLVEQNLLAANRPTPGPRCNARLATSLSPECDRFFSSSYLESHRSAFTSRFSGPHGPGDDRKASSPAVCSGLHTTPADFSAAALPDRLPPASGPRLA
jgi:hypothetical protein